MFKKITQFTVLLTMLLALFACGASVEFRFFNVSGQVIDARSDDASGVAGASVTFDGSETYSGTTDSSGYYDLSNVASGEYTVTITKSGWYFPPQTMYVGNGFTTMQNMPGVTLRSDDLFGITFMVMWNGSVDDIDLHITFPSVDRSDDSDTEAYFNAPNSVWAYNWNTGFGPSSTNRDSVYHAEPNFPDTATDSDSYAIFDRDDRDGYGPETATIRQIPFTYSYSTGTPSDFPVSPTNNNGLNDLFTGSNLLNYRWMGVAKVYLDGYSGNLSSTDGTGADAVVYAFQTVNDGADLSASTLGVFPIPSYIKQETISVVRINMFYDDDGYEDFMLVPDISIVGDTAGIRGSIPSLIGVRGRKAAE